LENSAEYFFMRLWVANSLDLLFRYGFNEDNNVRKLRYGFSACLYKQLKERPPLNHQIPVCSQKEWAKTFFVKQSNFENVLSKLKALTCASFSNTYLYVMGKLTKEAQEKDPVLRLIKQFYDSLE